MTDPLEIPETGEPVIDGLIFLAGATVMLGAAYKAGQVMANWLCRSECQERGR